jgi:hypothetical protein
MRCSLCRRTNRAIFARLFPGHAYLLLCSACLDHINAQIADGLQHALLVPACHTKHASRPDKSDEGMMNRDQWNGGLKRLKGRPRSTGRNGEGDIILETMGALERLLGMVQRNMAT